MGSIDNKDNTGIKGISDMGIGAAGAADESVELLINGFRLLQREPYAKLGMDSILLSAFLHPSKAIKICDLGCGAGALSILLAARYNAAQIVGVDIQKGAVDLLEENISINGVGDRVLAIQADLREIECKIPAGAYTAVVCNPPYFRQGAGKPGALAEKRVERTEEGARIDEICRAASRLLRNGGEFAAVYRAERLCDLLAAMRGAGIEPKRLRFVHGAASAEPKLLLIAGRKNAQPGIRVLPPFIIKKENGEFAEEYLVLYQIPGRGTGYDQPVSAVESKPN